MIDSIEQENNKVLDLVALKQVFMGDLKIINEILAAFQDSFKEFSREFDALLEQSDLPELARLVHCLKGSSANIRAQVLSDEAAKLQRLIERNVDFAESAQHLKRYLNALGQEISQLLNEEKAS